MILNWDLVGGANHEANGAAVLFGAARCANRSVCNGLGEWFRAGPPW